MDERKRLYVTVTKASACVCIYTRSCAAATCVTLCYIACLTPQDSMLDCIPVREAGMRLRKRRDERDLIVCLCSQYFKNSLLWRN